MSLFGPSVVRVLEAYAGCRQKACTEPEQLVGMGKSEWGLGMLHKRLGLCSFSSHIYTTQKNDNNEGQQSPQLPLSAILFTSLFLACSYINNKCQRTSSEYVSSTNRD